MACDVRSIANYVLDWSEQNGFAVSNMAINKIVFFLHVHVLEQFNEPLVNAKIEAWQHGPVFRELYHEFKKFGDATITSRANRINLSTGVSECCYDDLDITIIKLMDELLPRYCKLSASALRSLSHEPGGPWDLVWNYDGETNATMQISDEIIRNWFSTTMRH